MITISTPQFAGRRPQNISNSRSVFQPDCSKTEAAADQVLFQGIKKASKSQDSYRDKVAEQITKDEAILEQRNDWFKENRPEEAEDGGWVTTPGHSDDEDARPFSARRHAKKTGRWFDSITQTFKANPDKK